MDVYTKGECVIVKKMDYVQSLTMFNERVLSLGHVDQSVPYTMEDLKNKLFFNQAFINNMQELFQKHSYMEIVDDYINGLTQYIQNINMIIKRMGVIDPSVIFQRSDSFERRLITDINMQNQMITNFYPGDTTPKFLNNVIYYVTLLDNGYIAVSYIDPRKLMYEKVLCSRNNVYWKNDDCALSYIRSMYGENTIAMKITSTLNKDSEIVKVEFHSGNIILNSMDRIIRIFPENTLIVQNPFIYTDDIKRILELKSPSISVVAKQSKNRITFNDVFRKDVLIEYPSTSFDQYLDFLETASGNNQVESIYLSLYRIGENPSIYYILKRAVSNGIHVHVNIELEASGEKINKFWAREMQLAGIHVTTYSQWKVHCKLTLVCFRNGNQISQIGSGNYHTQTTTQYTDLSFMTSNQEICNQVKHVFDIFHSDVKPVFDNKVLVTRHNARKELVKLIDREASKSRNGQIIIKCNSLDDDEIIDSLDKAANSGCRIYLIIRGVCTWVSDKLGENVTVKSIVWDKLEHSRVYWFGRLLPDVYIGSLDLVTTKIDRRIETLVKIQEPDTTRYIAEYLNQYVTNSKHSWVLTSSGDYKKE
jgi:hypothetical protein